MLAGSKGENVPYRHIRYLSDRTSGLLLVFFWAELEKRAIFSLFRRHKKSEEAQH